ETIAAQDAEIRALRAQLEGERFAEALRRALTTAAAAGEIATPLPHLPLLELLVETAMEVISARAAALCLVSGETQERFLEVAFGQKAEEIKKFRVPLGRGIAGLVASTGQPMAVSDAQRDPRQAADIAERVGYHPRTILCVPLLYNDDVIGVLELLDRDGE